MKIPRFLGLFTLPFLLGLASGDRAPEFAAKNQDGKLVRSSDFKGKFVLIYFYPKDDTPGCTKEACKFRDEYAKIKKLNAVVLGVSRQGGESHREFRAKHRIPFDLLVDEDGSLAEKFGVGTIPILGWSKRKSVLLGSDGKVVRFYDDVDPDTHAQEVMRDIERAGK